jgi:hypothetical protein
MQSNQARPRLHTTDAQGQYYVTGRLTPSLYEPDALFTDPTTRVEGGRAWGRGAGRRARGGQRRRRARCFFLGKHAAKTCLSHVSPQPQPITTSSQPPHHPHPIAKASKSTPQPWPPSSTPPPRAPTSSPSARTPPRRRSGCGGGWRGGSSCWGGCPSRRTQVLRYNRGRMGSKPLGHNRLPARVAAWGLQLPENYMQPPFPPTHQPPTPPHPPKGTTQYSLDAAGLISRHEETWDISAADAFISTFLPAYGAPPAPPVEVLRGQQ